MNAQIVPLTEVEALESIAHDLRTHLLYPSNSDIEIEFPETFAGYTQDRQHALERLRASRDACALGKRELFIAMSGRRAVGMSIVTLLEEVPESIDPRWPNLSIFVCSPWRGQGIGRLAMEAKLRAVRARFGGNAWTVVRSSNVASKKLVAKSGFQLAENSYRGPSDHLLYTYEASPLPSS